MKEQSTGAFQAIVWKEMHESLKWAVLGLILVSAGLISAAHGLITASEQSAPIVIGVFGMTAFSALVGLMIGRAQIISENRGDAWGFLVHRPAPRTTVFWAKVTAGVLLYLAAVGTPLLLCAFWFSRPGNVAAPFDWRLTLPGIVDLICGLVFYFAGILTAMRDARWYGTRAIGIGLGFICALVNVTMIRTFWMAIVCCVIGITVTALAARGTFLSGGSYTNQSRISRAAVGAAVGSGLLVTALALLAFVMEFLVGPPQYRRTPVYSVSSEGTIVQIVYDDSGVQAVNDLNGHPIEKYKDNAARQAVERGVRRADAGINPQGLRDIRPTFDTGYRSTFDIYTYIPLQNGAFRWYYIHDRHLIACYDNSSKRLIGWLGPGGYTAGEAQPQIRFPGALKAFWSPWPGQGPSLLAFSDVVYRVDENDRRVSKIFTAPTGESILGAGSYSYPPEAIVPFDVIATTKNVYVQWRDTTPRLALPLDPRADGYGRVSVIRANLAPGTPTYVMYSPEGGQRVPLSDSRLMPLQVTQINNDGGIVAHITVPREDPGVNRTLLLGPTLITPLFLRGAVELAAPYKIFPPGFMPSRMLSGWIWQILLGIASAGFIFAQGRKYAFGSGRLLIWTVLGFAVGPLSVALMLSLIEWPPKEICPSCRRQRVVTREKCEHCGAPFPAPAPDGTEIFETVGI
jgi:hypothetical protein